MERRMRHISGRIGQFAVIALARATIAAAGQADLCLDAARTAAAATDVPVEVLVAITLTETGRTRDGVLAPWPWTINDSGDGSWFAGRDQAIAAAEAALAAGRTSFDTGCFQINYRWHAEAFPSLAAMFDPTSNALHAARFLSQLHAESGDWSQAAGAYHSRTPAHALRYRARFDAILAELTSREGPPSPRLAAADSANGFPFLRPREGRRAPGSLVPLDAGG